MPSVKLCVLSLAALILFSCTNKSRLAVDPIDSFISIKNIVYGADTLQQSMDVYLPYPYKGVPTTVVVLIHGGSWAQGDKSDFAGTGLDTFFTAKGCALVNINYRLYTTYSNAMTLEMEDVGMVMNYIKQKAANWNINPDKVCMFGKSSGAQIAMLYAYAHNSDGRIKSVIDAYGPTDFEDSSFYQDTLICKNAAALLGGPLAFNGQAWHDASPVFYMAGALPTVIMQGTLDPIVLPVQSQMLQDSLLNRGVPNLYFNWVGVGHFWDKNKWLECREQTWAFVNQYLN